MKKYFLILICFLTCYINAGETSQELFNGKDLSNWVIPTQNVWWTVSDGILIGTNDPKKKGSMLWTQSKFSNFTIELEFKMGDGIVDSGVFLRNQDQIQIGISGSLKRDMTASPYIPKKGYPVEARGVKELLKDKDWNTLKITAIGNKYAVWLNSTEVCNYESTTSIATGPIGLQVHPGKDMTVSFKNIKVTEIK
jgi:hypothetical protein